MWLTFNWGVDDSLQGHWNPRHNGSTDVQLLWVSDVSAATRQRVKLGVRRLALNYIRSDAR